MTELIVTPSLKPSKDRVKPFIRVLFELTKNCYVPCVSNFEDQRKNAEKYVNDLMGKIVARVTHENQWKILLQVHDEIVISAPREQMHAAMKCLKDAMESLEFDVPMLSEGEWSACNWAEMQDYDVKGSVVCDEI